MKWSEAAPTKPGVYWARLLWMSSPIIVRVFYTPSGLMIEEFGIAEKVSLASRLEVGAKWFGPIEEPP